VILSLRVVVSAIQRREPLRIAYIFPAVSFTFGIWHW